MVKELIVRIEPIISGEPELCVPTERDAGEVIIPIRFDVIRKLLI